MRRREAREELKSEVKPSQRIIIIFLLFIKGILVKTSKGAAPVRHQTCGVGPFAINYLFLFIIWSDID